MYPEEQLWNATGIVITCIPVKKNNNTQTHHLEQISTLRYRKNGMMTDFVYMLNLISWDWV